jgi:hypothetical protein
MIMLLRSSTCAVAVALAATLMMAGAVQAADDSKYPDWKGGWARWAPPNAGRDPGNGGTGFTAGGQPSFDQAKPWGLGQQAPLTPEYEKVLADSMADQATGGEGNFFDHAVRCMPGGMPIMTIAFTPLEFVVTPETTYILIGGAEHYRRIFTDGRDWPKDLEPTYAGYSIGRWTDEEITVIDHALTRPWTVDKKYVLVPNPRPNWTEGYCTENRSMIAIGTQSYFLSADGMLMPVRKGQAPPDLRYFKKAGN